MRSWDQDHFNQFSVQQQHKCNHYCKWFELGELTKKSQVDSMADKTQK